MGGHETCTLFKEQDTGNSKAKRKDKNKDIRVVSS